MWNERFKISFLIGGISVFVLLILLRLFFLQTVKHEFYSDFSTKQSMRQLTVNQDRGTIFDKNGVVLAENMKVASLYTYGKDVKSRTQLRKVFSRNGISLDKKVMNRLKKTKGFVWLKRNVSMHRAELISQRMDDVHYVTHENRYYPEKQLGAGVLGFTGIDNQGLYGVEIGLEDSLKGRKVQMVSMRDSRGKFILSEDKRRYEKPQTHLYLTIDSRLQGIAEAIISDDMKVFGAKKGIAVAMDVDTGDVLFDVSFPGFDPNKYAQYRKDRWKNAGTRYLFEPGSIFKPVTFSFMLESGLSLKKKVDCENGRYRVHGHTIKDVHRYKVISAEEVLVKSSNIGMVKLNADYQNKDFYSYLQSAGFGKASGVSGLSEESGFLRPYKKWSGLSKPSISIGQELLVTPMQMLRFYAAIANGGDLLVPQIVKQMTGENKFKKRSGNARLMSEETAMKLQDALRKVVIDGTGQNAKLGFMDIAGKTGTAQKFNTKKGVYSKKDYVAGFAGFFPAENPKIAMVVVYDSPKKSIYGGSTAAFSFKKIAEQIAIMNGFHMKRIQVADAS